MDVPASIHLRNGVSTDIEIRSRAQIPRQIFDVDPYTTLELRASMFQFFNLTNSAVKVTITVILFLKPSRLMSSRRPNRASTLSPSDIIFYFPQRDGFNPML